MSRPLVLLLDVTERCNLRCVMCHFANLDRIRFPPFDLLPANHGNMDVDLFERIAADFFPRAHRVSLACAAEPLMHPRFREIVSIAGRYGVPELWFPTNLLGLTEALAETVVRSNVATVAVSIDATRQDTYERIRTGAKWDRLLEKLALLRDVSARVRNAPRLRLAFAWMRSNRDELRELPAFAEAAGARELDVRFVAPTDGVDVSRETFPREERQAMRGELAQVAQEAVRRGLRLAGFPEYDERPEGVLARAAWRFWRIRAGLDRFEHLAIARREREIGCRYPDRLFVIRPSGAVFPCHYFDEPLGFAGRDSLASIAGGERLTRIREGLRCGAPSGACATCGNRRDAFYTVDAPAVSAAPASPLPHS